jgi:FtsH-binding integral membrane protein
MTVYTQSAIRKGMNGGGLLKNMGMLLKERGGFLASVFATLIFQILITIYVVYYIRQHNPDMAVKLGGWFIAIVLAEILIVLALALVPMPMWLKLVLFTGFSVLTGLLLSALRKISTDVLKAAMLATLGVFVGMFILGFGLAALGVDLGWMGLILLAALFGLIIVNIVMIFVQVSGVFRKLMLTVGIVLFSLFVMYDTNIILSRNYYGDYVTAAFDYYLDIINLFIKFARLFSDN